MNIRTDAYHPHFITGKKVLLFFCLSLWLSISAVAKAVIYDMHHGLSSNTIRSIAKDGRGLMWIGTHNGLNIFDGNIFSKMPGVLSSLTIIKIQYDPQEDGLWAMTNQGLYFINTRAIKATKINFAGQPNQDWNNLTGVTISVCTSGSFKLLVAYKTGVIAGVNAHNKLEYIAQLPKGADKIEQLQQIDHEKFLVVALNLHLVQKNNTGNYSLKSLRVPRPVMAVAKEGDALLLAYKNGQVNSLPLQDLNENTIQQLPYFSATPDQFYSKQAAIYGGILYANGNDYSFYKYNFQDGKSEKISDKYQDAFEGRSCNELFIDERNIIWLATNKGLLKIEDRNPLFDRLFHNASNRVSTRQILESKNGDLYIGSYVGLLHYSRQKNSWQHCPLPEDWDQVTLAPYAMMTDNSGNYIYLGYNGSELIKYNIAAKSFERIHYSKRMHGESLQEIYAMERGNNSIIWLGCTNGLASYDPVANLLTFHKKDKYDIGPNQVRCIKKSKTNGQLIYIGTTSGLLVLDIDKGIVARINSETRPALTNNDILCINQDKDGYLWVGTNGGGLNVIDPELKEVNYIRNKEGLSNDIVYSMLAQDEHTLWLGTYNGLDRYRKDLKTFINFFEEDGLSSNEFNHNSSLRLRDGSMLFGSINGISIFNPKNIGPAQEFDLFISGMSKWDDRERMLKLNLSEISNKQTVIKRPGDLLLELHLACTDYSNPLGNTYSYRIPLFSDEWISLENKHSINLGGMPYGNYRIEIAALNAQGTPASNILELNVKVLQPFYKTWWFFFLLLVAVSGMLYTIYRFQYHSLKKEHKLRVRIASNLHDDVGSLLTRITMFSDNLRYGKNSETKRNQKLEKIAILSRNATQSMSDVLWSIDSRNDFAGNLLDRMREHAEDMLLPLQIDINFVVADTDMKQHINTHDRRDLYLIFKEAIHNIAKHSQADQVTIDYTMQSNQFYIKIENNGNNTGQTDHHTSTGQGLSNMKMRAKKIGAHVEVTQTGALFSIIIQKGN